LPANKRLWKGLQLSDDSSAFLSIERDVPEFQMILSPYPQLDRADSASDSVEKFLSPNVVEWRSNSVLSQKQLLNPISWNLPLPQKLLGREYFAAKRLVGLSQPQNGLLALAPSRNSQNETNLVPATFALKTFFQSLLKHMAVNRKVKLRISPEVRSPILLGFFHPVVLLPVEDLTKQSSPCFGMNLLM